MKQVKTSIPNSGKLAVWMRYEFWVFQSFRKKTNFSHFSDVSCCAKCITSDYLLCVVLCQSHNKHTFLMFCVVGNKTGEQFLCSVLCQTKQIRERKSPSLYFHLISRLPPPPVPSRNVLEDVPRSAAIVWYGLSQADKPLPSPMRGGEALYSTL